MFVRMYGYDFANLKAKNFARITPLEEIKQYIRRPV